MKQTADKQWDLQTEKATLYAIIITIFALILRLYNLGQESLWIDEGFSLRDSANLHLLGETRPLYFLLLKGWMGLGAHSEFMMRLPSALFGAASVWVLFVIGKKLIGTKPSLLASAFMAVSVLQINHSQEVRMYSLVVFIILLSTYFLILFLETGRKWAIAGYLASAFAGLLTFPLTVLILITHGLYTLVYVKAYKPRSLVTISGLIVTAIVWVPWLMNNMQASTGYSEGYTATLEKPDPIGVVSVLGKFFLLKWTDGHAFTSAAIAFSVFLVLLMIYGISKFQKNDKPAVYTLMWLAVPVTGMVLLSYMMTNVWMVHYMITAAPAFYLLTAKSITTLRKRYVAVAVSAAIFIVTFGRLGIYYMKPARPEWRSAISYIRTHEKPGDVIALYYGGNRFVFDYYYHGISQWSPLGTEESTKEDFGQWTDTDVSNLLSTFPFKGKRCWLVLSHHTYRGGFQIIDYFRNHYKELDHGNYHLIEFYLFDGNGKQIPVGSGKKAGNE
ncbi:MAG: glycosyltransferase family 39 protein [Armatimonadota bacterium]